MSGYASATMAIVALAGTAMSVSAQAKQAAQQKTALENQQKVANYQAEVAQQNADLAQEQASAARKAGYDAATQKRQEVAAIIGRQRAVAGASGTTVDTGSNLDLNLDTAEKGEIDALGLQQQGLDQAHNLEVQAWNYENNSTALSTQAQSYGWQASNVDPTMSMASTALSGLSSVGKNFGTSLWEGGKWTPFAKSFGLGASSK